MRQVGHLPEDLNELCGQTSDCLVLNLEIIILTSRLYARRSVFTNLLRQECDMLQGVNTHERKLCQRLLYFSTGSYKHGGGAKLEVELSAAIFVLGICKSGPNTLKKFLIFTCPCIVI